MLEKDKVYKIVDTKIENVGLYRNYIICSPKNDIHTENVKDSKQIYYGIDDSSSRYIIHYIAFNCNFVICFSGRIIVSNDVKEKNIKQCTAHFYEDSNVITEFSAKDLEEIKKAVDKMGVKYNRKLNNIIFDA